MIARGEPDEGLTLRQAALTAGFGMLLMAACAPFAEFYVFPKLIVRGAVAQTLQNVAANRGLFLAGIFGYLINFACDVVITWGLYILFIPVNRALSLLAAWFRLVYTAIAVSALFKLVTVFHLATSPDYLRLFGPQELQAQVKLLLDSFRWEWSMSLMLFEVHLVLAGWLAFRSGYVPRIIGILLVIDGLGWLVDGAPSLFLSAGADGIPEYYGVGRDGFHGLAVGAGLEDSGASQVISPMRRRREVIVRPCAKTENATTAKVTVRMVSRWGRSAGRPRASARATAPRMPPQNRMCWWGMLTRSEVRAKSAQQG